MNGTFIRYVFYIFNIICLVGGIAIVVLGVLGLKRPSYTVISDLLGDEKFRITLYFLIALGVAVVIISVLGCCGVLSDSLCMTLTYAGILFVVIFAEIVMGYMAYSYKDGLDYKLEKKVLEAFNEPYPSPNRDRIQEKLQCCGRNGLGEYGHGIPPSCCSHSFQDRCDAQNAYQTGCLEASHEFSIGLGKLIGVVTIIFGCLELIGFILACCVSTSMAEDEYDQQNLLVRSIRTSRAFIPARRRV